MLESVIGFLKTVVPFVKRRVEHALATRKVICNVPLGISRKTYYDEIAKEIDGFYCLISRYGRGIANDQEGRVQNKIRHVPLGFDEQDNAALMLEVPVHKRLETQFKCFVAVPESLVDKFIKIIESAINFRALKVPSTRSSRLSKSAINFRAYHTAT